MAYHRGTIAARVKIVENQNQDPWGDYKTTRNSHRPKSLQFDLPRTNTLKKLKGNKEVSYKLALSTTFIFVTYYLSSNNNITQEYNNPHIFGE